MCWGLFYPAWQVVYYTYLSLISELPSSVSHVVFEESISRVSSLSRVSPLSRVSSLYLRSAQGWFPFQYVDPQDQYKRPCKIKCTCDCHLGKTLKYQLNGLKLPRYVVIGLPLTQRVKILQKKKTRTIHITHHTSHRTYCIWILKFYNTLRIIMLVPFNNS